MSVAEAKPSPLPSIRKKSLKIVLFGMEGSGKTSLLAALAQATKSKKNVHKVKVIDQTGNLDELIDIVYNREPPPTQDEIVAYPIKFEYSVGNNENLIKDIVIFDCNGNEAKEYLREEKNRLVENENPLAQAILNADTLILALEASSPDDKNDIEFDRFVRFLRILEEYRSKRGDVSGLPVYWVLTQCDCLAKHNDSLFTWEERIAERKRKIATEFQKYMSSVEAKKKLPFGKIDFHVWATATKRPQLGNHPARPNEPYQVAELFKLCVESAVKYQDSKRRANFKAGIFIAVVCFILGMLILFLFLSIRE